MDEKLNEEAVCEDCGGIHTQEEMDALFESTFGELFEKPTLKSRIQRFFFRHRKSKFLLSEQELAIAVAIGIGGDPSKGSAVQQLVTKLAEQSNEIDRLVGTLRFGTMISQMSVEAMNRLRSENSELRSVVLTSLENLDRVRSESKIIRQIKADLNSVVVNDNGEDKATEEDAAAA